MSNRPADHLTAEAGPHQDPVRQAEQLLSAGRVREAWGIALPEAKTAPLRADVWRILGDITWLGRAPDKSARAYRRALVIDPLEETARIGMAQAAEAVPFADRNLWSSTMNTLPMAPQPLLKMCIVGAVSSSRWGTALSAVSRLEGEGADPLEAWVAAMAGLADSGDWASAVRAARIAAVLYPGEPRLVPAVAALKRTMDVWSPGGDADPTIEEAWTLLQPVADGMATMARRVGQLPTLPAPATPLEPMAAHITRSIVSAAEAGAKHVGWDRDKAMADVVRVYRYDISPENRQAIVGVLRRHFPDLDSNDLIPCPHCGERHRLNRRNRSPITGEARVLFDLEAIAADVAPYLPVEKPNPFHLSLIISYVCKAEGIARDVAECSNCGMVYLNWRYQPSVLDRYYERRDMPVEETAESRYYGAASYYPWVRRKANPMTWLRSRIGPFTGMDVLDVGAGDGSMMWFARRLGGRVSGIEPSLPSAAFARDILGLPNARAGYYRPDAFGPEAFDLIYSFHALEHFEDIGLFREGVCRHLRPGGHLMVSVPCVETDQPEVFKDVGNSHFIGLRPAFLLDWLRAGGFEILDCKVTDGPRRSSERDHEHGGPLWSGIKSDVTVLARKPA